MQIHVPICCRLLWQQYKQTLWCFVALFVITMPITAQTITVSNLLDTSAPLVREGLALIEGESFTDEEASNLSPDVKLLAGVKVRLDGVDQVLRAVTPQRVEFVVDAPGASSRLLELFTKSGAVYRVQVNLVNVWPSIILQSRNDDDEGYLAAGFWTIDTGFVRSISISPVAVGRPGRPTLVTIQGAGWRYASVIRVRLNGVPCQVVAKGPSIFPGQDELVFQVPSQLAGRGEFDLYVIAQGRESNQARLVLGNAPNN